MSEEPILELKNISKNFGAVQALQGVDMELFKNDVLALVGDNGAGKSTLIKIISGAFPPSAGTMKIWGEEVHDLNPRKAKDLNIETIHQELDDVLLERFSVAENVFLGREITRESSGPLKVINFSEMKHRVKSVLDRLGITVGSPSYEVKNLSGGQRQAVAVARAIYWDARIIIMDEPTAALGVEEVNKVLNLISRLHEQGATVILISHNLDHVFQVADRVMVLRNGRCVGDHRIDEVTHDQVVSLITGSVESL